MTSNREKLEKAMHECSYCGAGADEIKTDWNEDVRIQEGCVFV
jgi:hypothetical protein